MNKRDVQVCAHPTPNSGLKSNTDRIRSGMNGWEDVHFIEYEGTKGTAG